MAYIGEMQYLTIGNNTYSLPTGGGDGTVTSVGVSNATNGGLSVSGSPITTAGTITIGHSNILSSAQTTQAVYPIKIDKNGHISEYGSAVTIPTKTSDLTNDSGFITSYTDEKLKWTASTSSNTYYPLQSTSTATTSTANTLNGISFYQYYNTAGGYRRLDLGNSTAYKSTGGAYGTIRLYGSAATYYGDLVPGVLGTTSGDGHISANRTWTLPDKTGTVALTSDIPSVPTITLNGSSTTTPSFYAPTSAGTSGYVLKSNGSGAPTWTSATLTDEKLRVYALNTTAQTAYDLVLSYSSSTAETKYVTNGLQITHNDGSATVEGNAILKIGTNVAKGTAGNQTGKINLYGDTAYRIELKAGSPTSHQIIAFPDKSGTIALTSDIPTNTDENVKSTLVTTGGTYYIVGSSNSSTNTSTLNKHDSVSFFVTTNTSAGDARLILGNSIASGTNSKKGLVRLYGSTAYYTDIISGAPSENRTITLPNATGTIALISDIPVSDVTVGGTSVVTNGVAAIANPVQIVRW